MTTLSDRLLTPDYNSLWGSKLTGARTDKGVHRFNCNVEVKRRYTLDVDILNVRYFHKGIVIGLSGKFVKYQMATKSRNPYLDTVFFCN